jgi:hypothetical protein
MKKTPVIAISLFWSLMAVFYVIGIIILTNY